MILSSRQGDTGVIQFDNAKKLNSLNMQLITELMGALDRLPDEGCRVIILRAQPGARVWSAGHDIRELPEPRRDPLAYGNPLENLLRRIQDCPVPVIAMVEGSVWGGACDLCCACDLVVATREASFAMTPAKIGIPYNASGLLHFIHHIGVHKAKEMFFSASPISAEEAWNNGFVNRIVDTRNLETETFELAGRIAANAPLAVRAIKAEFRLLTRGGLVDAETAEQIQQIRRQVYDSADYAEGIRAFLEKRPPQFRGC